MARPSVDTLIARTLAGDGEAWTELAGRVHAHVLSTCTSMRSREGLTFLADEELAREVAVCVLDRLRADDYRVLASFADVVERYRAASPEADGERHFARWLSVVSRRLRIDYLRSLPEYQRVREGGRRAVRSVTLASLTDDDGAAHFDAAAASVDRAESRRILDVLAHPAFPAEQRRALILWLQGYDAGEVAAQLGLAGADAARKLLRAARQRLRRKVGRASELRAIEGGRR